MFTLLIEKIEPREVYGHGIQPHVRGIIFEIEEETGAKSVRDIVETHSQGAEYLLEAIANGYPGWKFEGWQVQATNMGRARTNRTMIRKIVEQLFRMEPEAYNFMTDPNGAR
jgi:hypothetical protein